MADFNININADVTDSNTILGETVAADDLLYLSTDSKWYKANANLPSKSTTELRIALQAGVLNDAIISLTYGYHSFTTNLFSPGTKYYVSGTAGTVTSNILTPNVVRYIGTAYSSSVMLFNPDQTYLSDNNRKVSGQSINISHVHVEADITDLDKYTQAEVNALVASAAGDKHYLHTQATGLTSWIVNHAMNKQYPAVQCYDGFGNRLHGDITFTDVNNTTITFNASYTGTAVFN